MAAAFTVSADTIAFEKPRAWTERRYRGRGPNRMFDLHPDGTRVALPLSEPAQEPMRLTFFFNFFEELRKLAPAR